MTDDQNPNSDKSKTLTGVELAEVYKGYIEKYDIVSIEDPFDQDDWEAWTAFNTSTKVQVVGDDLTVTNPLRIKTAVEKKACNALLLKVGLTWVRNAESLDQPDRYHLRVYPGVSFLANLVVGSC